MNSFCATAKKATTALLLQMPTDIDFPGNHFQKYNCLHSRQLKVHLFKTKLSMIKHTSIHGKEFLEES